MKQKIAQVYCGCYFTRVLTGWICHHFFNEGEQLKQIASYFNIVTDIFYVSSK